MGSYGELGSNEVNETRLSLNMLQTSSSGEPWRNVFKVWTEWNKHEHKIMCMSVYET